MALVVVGYVKSRPGATTIALGLAAVLPPRVRPVVVECDPAGGDLAARRGLTASPGLVELATATRSIGPRAGAAGGDAAGADVLSRVVRRVRVGDREVEVVVAPAGGAQTRVALSVLARPGSSALTDPGRVVIADCGRLDFASPARPLLGVADVVLVLTRGRLDEVAHLREHTPVLASASRGHLVVVLAAGGAYGGEDVAEVLAADGAEIPVRGPLPYDERSAAVVDGRRVAGRRWRRWRRWPLFAALEQLAADLPDGLDPSAAMPAADVGVR